MAIFGGKSFASETLLSPDDAFQFSARQIDANTVEVVYTIANGYYLYKNRFQFDILPHAESQLRISQPLLPDGEKKQDPTFGLMEVYHHQVRFKIPLLENDTRIKNIALKITSQGCADVGVCYPPQAKLFVINASNLSMHPENNENEWQEWLNTATQTDAIQTLFASQSYGMILVSFFGFGLLLAFTPCVFPMIPILSSIILGQDKTKLTTGKSFLLSGSYIVGMASMYTLAGILAALSGKMFAQSLQTIWVIAPISLIFVLLAFASFGFYDIQLPSRVQSFLATKTQKFEGGQWISVGIMGALSALIVGPCVAAPLAGALIYISQSKNILLGGSALFVMAIGMGLPLMLIGTSAGRFLPKAGAWMNKIKFIFGLVFLATAIWLISPFVSPLWSNQSEARSVLPFETIHSEAEFKQILETTQDKKQFLVLDFYADWCVSCKEFEHFTLSDPVIQKQMKQMRLVRVDITNNTASDQALLKKYHLFGPPALLFFTPDGQEIRAARMIGFQNPKQFQKTLNQVRQPGKKPSLDTL